MMLAFKPAFLHFDNYFDNELIYPKMQGFGPWSLANFQQFLARHVSADQRRALGVTDPAAFDLRQYIAGKPYPPRYPSAFLRQTLGGRPAVERLRLLEAGRFAGPVPRAVRLLQIDQPPPGDRSGRGRQHHSDLPRRLAGHRGHRPGPLRIPRRRAIRARAGAAGIAAGGQAGRRHPTGRRPGHHRLLLAQRLCAARSSRAGPRKPPQGAGLRLPGQPWRAGLQPPIHARRLARLRRQGWINHFIGAYAAPLGRRRPLAQVGLVFPGESLLGSIHVFSMDPEPCLYDYLGWSLGLTEEHVAWDAVCDDQLRPDVLGRFAVIVLPSAACLSDAALDALAGYVRGGGRVIASGEPGTRLRRRWAALASAGRANAARPAGARHAARRSVDSGRRRPGAVSVRHAGQGAQ